MGSHRRSNPPPEGILPDADARLLEQIRSGDAEASHRFVREHYPAVYRYLLSLTGQPALAEDLTQETFVQGWRHLDTFEGRASLRTWLHRIARREFLQALRRKKSEAPLEAMAEAAAPDAAAWTDTVELHALIDRLPLKQREVVLLHYLEGYSSTEIARIVAAPVGTVCYRLARAREQLRQALGEDDLRYLNEPLAPMHQWRWLPLEQMHALQARLAVGGQAKEDEMERREFLRQAAVGAAGLMLPEAEKEVIDSRLTQKVTCAFKGTALSDLCEKLKSDTSIQLTAGPSVADEKVTMFCEKLPLREVMRQLSRPFGYTWLRSGTPGQYRYELAQDLRSQLLEEELRNRDRNAALLALEQDIERYRPYLDLSPDEALARAQEGSGTGGASPEEKKRLENLAKWAWGPIQMYFRLTPQEQAALRAGAELTFAQEPKTGELPLPPDIARGVLQTRRDLRIVRTDPIRRGAGAPAKEADFRSVPDTTDASSVPLTAAPDVQAIVILKIIQPEPGSFGLDGQSGARIPGGPSTWGGDGPYAEGRSPVVVLPNNRMVNARLAGDPMLRSRVSLQPQPSCGVSASTEAALMHAGSREGDGTTEERDETCAEPKATSADVLQALHRATGMPLVADFYTRLYKLEEVAIRDEPLFEALCRLCDGMGLRWHKEADTREAGGWLHFRSTSFYDDRLKEVPNRLLSRWAMRRRQEGTLTLDDVTDIAGLSDPQLNAADMASGARMCWRLVEWDLARNRDLRPHLRFLASLTPQQRRTAQSAEALRFDQMTLAQQQQYLALGIGAQSERLQSLEELIGATLRVDYTQPGEFEWKAPERPGKMPPGRLSLVRARTRESTLAAAHRLDPEADITQIVPTELALTIVYRWGNPKSGSSTLAIRANTGGTWTWGHHTEPPS